MIDYLKRYKTCLYDDYFFWIDNKILIKDNTNILLKINLIQKAKYLK